MSVPTGAIVKRLDIIEDLGTHSLKQKHEIIIDEKTRYSLISVSYPDRLIWY